MKEVDMILKQSHLGHGIGNSTVSFLLKLSLLLLLVSCASKQKMTVDPSYVDDIRCDKTASQYSFEHNLVMLDENMLNKDENYDEMMMALINPSVCSKLTNNKDKRNSIKISVNINRSDNSKSKYLSPNMDLTAVSEITVTKNNKVINKQSQTKSIKITDYYPTLKVPEVILDKYIKPEMIELINKNVKN